MRGEEGGGSVEAWRGEEGRRGGQRKARAAVVVFHRTACASCPRLLQPYRNRLSFSAPSRTTQPDLAIVKGMQPVMTTMRRHTNAQTNKHTHTRKNRTHLCR